MWCRTTAILWIRLLIIFVFHGDAEIQNFPGNYTQFREWKLEKDKIEAEEIRAEKADKNIKAITEQGDNKKRIKEIELPRKARV